MSEVSPAMSKTAYLMLGHGLESSPHNDRVPPGCTLVVKASVCEPTYTKFIDFVNDSNQEKFLDPVTNVDQIIDHYGPVAIYKEGDVYPNLKYNLFAYHEGDYGNLMMSSGILQHPFDRNRETFIDEGFLEMGKGALTFSKYYANSIYPTKEYVEAKIKEMSIAEKMPPSMLSISGLVRFIKKYKPFVISQKQLFDFVREGKFAPGAFYNFSCRSLSSNLKSKMLGYNATGRKMILPKRRLNLFKTEDNAARLAHIQELNESRSRQNLRGSLFEPLLRNKLHESYKAKKNSNTRRVLKQQIEEVELHRKPYIKMHYEKKTQEKNDGSKKVGGRRKTRKVKKN